MRGRKPSETLPQNVLEKADEIKKYYDLKINTKDISRIVGLTPYYVKKVIATFK